MTETYLRDAQIAEQIGVARKTIWLWAKQGKFPRPIKLSDRVTRWRASDVERWEAERKDAA